MKHYIFFTCLLIASAVTHAMEKESFESSDGIVRSESDSTSIEELRVQLATSNALPSARSPRCKAFHGSTNVSTSASQSPSQSHTPAQSPLSSRSIQSAKITEQLFNSYVTNRDYAKALTCVAQGVVSQHDPRLKDLLQLSIEKGDVLNIDRIVTLIADTQQCTYEKIITNKGVDTWQPIHMATHLKHASVIDLLVYTHGQDVNAKTAFGLTPLHIAALANDRVTAATLIGYGAKIDEALRTFVSTNHLIEFSTFLQRFHGINPSGYLSVATSPAAPSPATSSDSEPE